MLVEFLVFGMVIECVESSWIILHITCSLIGNWGIS